METKFTVYYTDKTSEIINLKRLPGHHPNSIGMLIEALLLAEKTGRTVEKIGTSRVNPLSKPPEPIVIDDNLITRADLLNHFKKVLSPMPKQYRHLF